MKIKELESLASEWIGDPDAPELFFVSSGRRGVVMIARDFEAAYRHWQDLPRNIETTLEGTHYGVICDTSPREDNSTRLRTYDEAHMFKAYRKQYRSDGTARRAA